MRLVCWWSVVCFSACLVSAATAEVIISEIMYNPGGADAGREWVELYNSGMTPIDLGLWTLQDVQDGERSAAITPGTLLGPAESLVLTPDANTFDAIWGPGLPRYELSNFPNLANSPSATNETVAIVDRNASLRDQVNYDDEGAWPRDNGSVGHSISVRPEWLSAAANDAGALWVPTMNGVYGGRYINAGAFGQHHASPGFVTEVPQPALAPSDDAAWSMVILPDTQNYAKDTVNRPVFRTMTEWIRDQSTAWGIQAVLHEGDIVN
ncbi:MAG: lamin tail domain-containing protein, partial [Planctomycetota bacterium]